LNEHLYVRYMDTHGINSDGCLVLVLSFIYSVDSIDKYVPGTMIVLYLMVCSIQKEMIAKLCWGFKEFWAFKYVRH